MRRRQSRYEGVLTPREQEVLALLREGLTNEQIAARLDISFSTARYHVAEILSKLGVSNRQEAAAWRAGEPRHRFGLHVFIAAMHKPGLGTLGKAFGVGSLAVAAAGMLFLLFGVLTSHNVQSLGKLAYIQGGDVWVRELPDGAAHRLTDGGVYLGPTWSPSGEWLTFYRDNQGRDPTMFVSNADGTLQRELETPASWAPRVDELAYLVDHLGGAGTLVVENADGSGRRIVATSTDDRKIVAMLPGWSPDGRWLAFAAEVPRLPGGSTSGRVALFRAKADGSFAEQVFAYDLPNVSLTFYGWSPGGDYLLLSMLSSPATAYDGVAPRTLLAVALDGAPEAPPGTDLVIFDALAPQPGGTAVAFSGGNGDVTHIERIATYDPGTATLRYLTPDDVRSLQPAWSPDGARIAYTSGPSPAGLVNERIWLMNSDGSDARQLTDDEEYRDEAPQWSADGRRVLFARMRFEQPASPKVSLWWLDPATRDVAPLDVTLDTPSLWDPRYSGPFGITQGHVQWDLVLDWWRSPRTPGD